MFEKSQMSPELQVRCRSDGKSQTEPVPLSLKRHSLKVGVNWNSNYCLNLVSNTACREFPARQGAELLLCRST